MSSYLDDFKIVSMLYADDFKLLSQLIKGSCCQIVGKIYPLSIPTFRGVPNAHECSSGVNLTAIV